MTRHRGRAPSKRQLRVGEELRHILANLLARGETRDPALQGVSITVTEVRVSPDLRNATAYVLPLGGGETRAAAAIAAALNRAAPFLRGRLGHEVDLKYTPALHFEADLSFDRADRIEALLRAEAQARPTAAPSETDDGA